MRHHPLLAAALLVATACRSEKPAATEEPSPRAADTSTAAASGPGKDGASATASAGPNAGTPRGAVPAPPAGDPPGGRKPRLVGGMASAEASPPAGEKPGAPAGKPAAAAGATATTPASGRPPAAGKDPAAGKTPPAGKTLASGKNPAPGKNPAAATGAGGTPEAETPATAENGGGKEPDAGAREGEPGGGKLIAAELMAETAQPRPAAGGPDGGRRPREQTEPAVASAGGSEAPAPDERPGGGRMRPSSAPDPEAAGGGLPIPGAEITFQASRVRRFLDSGGTSLDGRVVDADTGKVVDAADIEAWMGTRSVEAETDPQGRFRFEGLIPGSRLMLWITAAPTYVQERTEVVVPANQTSFQGTFRLLSRSALSGAVDGGAGMFLSRRGSRTVVTGLAAFGPAERAGVRVGDAIVAVGKRKVGDLGPGAIDYLLRGTIGSELDLTVQTGSEPPRKLQMLRSAR